MTAAPGSSTTPAAAAQRLAWGVVLLAAAFAGVSVVLTPASIRTTAMRFVIIALLGVLVGRGMRAARILLVLFHRACGALRGRARGGEANATRMAFRVLRLRGRHGVVSLGPIPCAGGRPLCQTQFRRRRWRLTSA